MSVEHASAHDLVALRLQHLECGAPCQQRGRAPGPCASLPSVCGSVRAAARAGRCPPLLPSRGLRAHGLPLRRCLRPPRPPRAGWRPPRLGRRPGTRPPKRLPCPLGSHLCRSPRPARQRDSGLPAQRPRGPLTSSSARLPLRLRRRGRALPPRWAPPDRPRWCPRAPHPPSCRSRPRPRPTAALRQPQRPMPRRNAGHAQTAAVGHLQAPACAGTKAPAPQARLP